MEMEKTGRGTLPEEILLAILPGLPLKTLGRFKCVSKPWKSLIESSYFGRLFVSLHKNPSKPSWSLMVPATTADRLSPPPPIVEALGFHGCEKWNLSKSPGSYLVPDPNLPTFYRASSNGLVLIEIGPKSFVGNPVIQSWFEIPEPPQPRTTATGLVTRVEEDGKVSSFKVVRTCESSDSDTNEWRVCVYSSESGLWSYKRLFSSHLIHKPSSCDSMSLNEMIYLLEPSLDPSTEPDVLIAYDFYSGAAAGGDGGSDKCRVIDIPLADHTHLRRCSALSHIRRCLTSSGGYVFFIELVDRRLRMWRLKKDTDPPIKKSFYDADAGKDWRQYRLSHILSVGFMKNCFPLAMNPFDIEIIYLWSLQHGCFVSGNLFGQRFKVHEEAENWNWRSSDEGCCRVNTDASTKGYMKDLFDADKIVVLSQFVLPQWMDSVPVPTILPPN